MEQEVTLDSFWSIIIFIVFSFGFMSFIIFFVRLFFRHSQSVVNSENQEHKMYHKENHKPLNKIINENNLLQETKFKNIEAEAYERVEQKKQQLLNKKYVDLEAEAYERVEQKKQQLLSNLEIESKQNLPNKSNFLEQKNAQPIEDTSKKTIRTSILKMLSRDKKDLKKAFILQQILNRPEY